jgi:hypothetical protein
MTRGVAEEGSSRSILNEHYRALLSECLQKVELANQGPSVDMYHLV